MQSQKQIQKPQVITKSGDLLKRSFNPKLLANFQDNFNTTTHRRWDPVFKADMLLYSGFDFFRWLVHRVKNYNESYDIMIIGQRGIGKSTLGVSMAEIIQPYFDKRQFTVDHVCFDVESWQELTEKLSRQGGGVVILDEVGTEGSLSSRTSMSQGNREASDIVQMMRTDHIITIYITLDSGRIDKRVRDLASVMGTPIGKLSNEDTNGYGLAVEADVRLRASSPAPNVDGYIEHTISQLTYAPKGKIHSIIVPHPKIGLWQEYSELRDIRLKEIRQNAQKEDEIGQAAANFAAMMKRK